MKTRAWLYSFLALSSLSNSAEAVRVGFSGFVSGEMRAFAHGSQLDGQKNGSGVSLVAEPEIYVESESGNHTFTFTPFVRIDPQDSDREHADIRELNWRYDADAWELKVGLSKVFWGVVESNHLVDIINQTDEAENIDREEKLGQPMVQVSKFTDWGTFRAFLLPYFRERTFAGSEGRLRTALPVDTDGAVYETAMKDRHLSGALRYEHTFGDWDVGIAHFSGISREPRLVAGVNAAGQNVLFPHYDIIDQTSLDLQLTTESALYKFEAITRSGQGERFTALSGGLEYTFYGVSDSDVDIGMLAEYHVDDRGAGAPATLFNDDFFFGTRIALNDPQSTEFLGGVLFDRLTKNRSYSVEASRRFGDSWKGELEMRTFSGKADLGSLSVDKEDFLTVRLSRFF